jgi:CRISPR-associated protein Csb1
VLRVIATYQPAGGPGSKVFPPTYPASDNKATYQTESRMLDGRERPAVLLDSVPSQANRAEEALLRAQRSDVVSVPLIQVDHDGEASAVLTSLEFPHRYADAYLRDSLLDGVAFDKTDLGRSLQAASLEDATALFAHDPGSLIYGAWNSHRKGRQRKFPRVYASEVIGWDPVEGRRHAGRMDPLNLCRIRELAQPGQRQHSGSHTLVRQGHGMDTGGQQPAYGLLRCLSARPTRLRPPVTRRAPLGSHRARCSSGVV